MATPVDEIERDRALAADIGAAVEQLNAAISKAHDARLRVELIQHNFQQMKDRWPCPALRADVMRRVGGA